MNVRNSIEKLLKDTSEASNTPMQIVSIKAQVAGDAFDMNGDEAVTKLDIELRPATAEEIKR